MADSTSHDREKPWSRRGWPKATSRTVWPYITGQQVELFKEVFDIFDTDGKGFFTADELMEVMTAMGGRQPTMPEVEGVLYEMDANSDRMVDFAEFLSKFYTCMSEESILAVFNQLAIQQPETEGSSKVLTVAALERCFAYVGDPLSDADRKYLEIMFQGADKDGSGTLDINEFVMYLEKLEDDMAQGGSVRLGSGRPSDAQAGPGPGSEEMASTSGKYKQLFQPKLALKDSWNWRALLSDSNGPTNTPEKASKDGSRRNSVLGLPGLWGRPLAGERAQSGQLISTSSGSPTPQRSASAAFGPMPSDHASPQRGAQRIDSYRLSRLAQGSVGGRGAEAESGGQSGHTSINVRSNTPPRSPARASEAQLQDR